ncbi:hypothetical protein NL438_26320, partial [Klebsiella pneumoniae]|nr:hypothetical protein [Klebsiella pneumoniae]
LVGNAGTASVGGSEIPHNEDNTSFSTGLNGRLQTGLVSHQIAIGASTIWTEQENAYTFYSSTTGNTNIYNRSNLPKPTAVSFTGGD